MASISCDEKSPKLNKRQRSEKEDFCKLQLCDCKCPICMSILIEPVRMPCNHELCMPCFRQNVEEANFTCPMCRLRISNWARRCARGNRLVDQARWKAILEAFPDQCRRRLQGEENEEDDDDLDPAPVKRICEPGAIQQEYEEAVNKLKRERQQMAEIEIKKSEEYIAWLQREEVRQYEEQHAELLWQQRLDEEFARKMSQGEESSRLEDESRARDLHNQALKDEAYARKLQQEISKGPLAVVTPPQVTTVVSKRGSRTSGSSSMKCLRIDKFLSPRQSSPSSQTPSRASWSRSTTGASSPDSRVPSGSSPTSSIGLDFDKPSTSKEGQGVEAVLIGDPPWGDSSIECMLEIVPDEASPVVSSPSPGRDSEGERSLKGCLLLPELDLKERESPAACAKKESAFECFRGKSEEEEEMNIDEEKKLRKRSDSMTSTDSISPELNHFRPIDVSPRTLHRRLADGRRESPKIVHTTPRNLRNMGDAQEDDGGLRRAENLAPLVRSKFESLIREKRRRLVETSKSTMTGAGMAAVLMQKELKRRMKLTGSRHVASAGSRQVTKPDKMPLASSRVSPNKNGQERLKQPITKNSSGVCPRWTPANSENGNAATTESAVKLAQRYDASKPRNGNVHIKESNLPPALDGDKKRQSAKVPAASSIAEVVVSSGTVGHRKQSPGKVYRMNTNQPQPKQATVKRLFQGKDGITDCDHSISPKRRKIVPPPPSNEDALSPPLLPSLVQSQHHGKLPSYPGDAERRGWHRENRLDVGQRNSGLTPEPNRTAKSPEAKLKEPAGKPTNMTPSKTRRNTVWKYMELVNEEEQRIRQEDEDRQLAVRLQGEFDGQERRKVTVVDRSRGTEAAYPLRNRFGRGSACKKVTIDGDSDEDIFA